MEATQIDYSAIIIDTINTLFSNLFSSLDKTLYSLLDDLVFIDTSVIEDSFFEKALGNSFNSGITAICSSLLFGFLLYYCFKLLISIYTSSNIENPYQVVIKAVIFGICILNSQFICRQIIYINSLISTAIQEIGSYSFNTEISFSKLITQVNSFAYTNSDSFNLFTFDGILKSFISIGLLNLLFSYSLRYIMVKLFILLSPFAFLSLINQSTSWFFKTWFRNFLSLLLIQSFISLIFLIILSFKINSSSEFSQLIYIGAIYALTKSNTFLRELIGGISTDVSTNIYSLKSLLK